VLTLCCDYCITSLAVISTSGWGTRCTYTWLGFPEDRQLLGAMITIIGMPFVSLLRLLHRHDYGVGSTLSRVAGSDTFKSSGIIVALRYLRWDVDSYFPKIFVFFVGTFLVQMSSRPPRIITTLLRNRKTRLEQS